MPAAHRNAHAGTPHAPGCTTPAAHAGRRDACCRAGGSSAESPEAENALADAKLVASELERLLTENQQLKRELALGMIVKAALSRSL